MTNITGLAEAATKFRATAATIRATADLMAERSSALEEQAKLAGRWIRKDPERQTELLAIAQAKLGTATELGDETIRQVRDAVASLRATKATEREAIASEVEGMFQRQLASGIASHPGVTPGEAFAHVSGDTVDYWYLHAKLDDIAAKLDAAAIVHAP